MPVPKDKHSTRCSFSYDRLSVAFSGGTAISSYSYHIGLSRVLMARSLPLTSCFCIDILVKKSEADEKSKKRTRLKVHFTFAVSSLSW